MKPPILHNVRLTQIEANAPELDDNRAQHAAKFEHQVAIKVVEQEKPQPVIILVRIQATVRINKSDEETLASIKSAHIGMFSCDPEATFDDCNTQMKDRDFQKNLVVQVFPLVNFEILRLLDNMGYTVKDIPLSIPDLNEQKADQAS